ncbi:MAG: gamma-glutamyl-gamma-aminobutyrate hydrolase family protein, partial [Clostridia bacterium]|nr:gamma-glutamyl-gamma-aminobutyrate hydrolase family protein [Clostridia bacterium]
EGTILGELAIEKTYAVNSFHHQAAKDVASGLVVSARSEDGVIEGLEMPSAPFVVGVQWHPERLVGHDQNAKALLRRFVREAEKGR